MKRISSHGCHREESSFVALLKACSERKDLQEGSRLHTDILKKGLLEKCPRIASTLINMYSKCGRLCKARQVLEELPFQDIVCWNALFAGYAQRGLGNEALGLFQQLKCDGLSPNEVTFICILKACGSIKAIDKGRMIHNEILKRGLLLKDIMLGTALVDMYVKCGVLVKAQEALEELPIRSTVSWNALIAGYAQQGQAIKVLDCFERLKSEGLSPDEVTFLSILKACGSLRALERGMYIHEEIIGQRLMEKHMVLGNAVVDMYARCGMLSKAREVLEGLSHRDIVSWNALIAGCVQQGRGYEALTCFEEIRSAGLSPDVITYTCILKACGEEGNIDKGKQMHEEVISKGLLEKDIVLGNALVDMYSKCGWIGEAQKVLERLPEQHVVSWSALIAGYVQQERGHEALECFERMQSGGLSPDMVTFICLLKACGSIGAIDKGKQIHDEIVHRGFLEKNTVVGTALVDMYAKCGLLEKAKQVLDELSIRNRVTWSALVAGYAQKGQVHEALDCFQRMQNDGIAPDEIIFLCVLSACSHSGLLDEAQVLYRDMSAKYDLLPNLEHHTCMVTAFGFAGRFEKALSIINSMSSYNHAAVWLALLGACRKWGNVKLGILAFDQIVQLDNCAAAYVFMANIFAAAGMQQDADKIEALRLKYDIKC